VFCMRKRQTEAAWREEVGEVGLEVVVEGDGDRGGEVLAEAKADVDAEEAML